MSKRIMIIEDCQGCYESYKRFLRPGRVCLKMFEEHGEMVCPDQGTPDWCPLMKMPEPACVYLDEGFTPIYDNWEAGWDDLLEQIGGWEYETDTL